MLRLGLRETYLRTLYGRWPDAPQPPQPGYTLLMPVPPDLPVFFKLAVDVCARQDLSRLHETLVIPDRFDPSFRPVFEQVSGRWPQGRMRLLEPGPVDRLTRRVIGLEGGRIHWLQIVLAVNATRTTHALLHDVDLFLLDRDFLRTQYEECVERGLGCMGLQTRWPHPGLDHLMGPWEIVFDLGWMRGHSPFKMCPQNYDFPATAQGTGVRRLWADSTMLGQFLTAPQRLGIRTGARRFIHFESVLWNYRRLQAATAPFEDAKLSILLIRLLIDAYDPDANDTYGSVPSIEQLTRGTTDPASRVTYCAAPTRANYSTFRQRMEQLICSPIIEPDKAHRLRAGLAPFDEVFEWQPVMT